MHASIRTFGYVSACAVWLYLMLKLHKHTHNVHISKREHLERSISQLRKSRMFLETLHFAPIKSPRAVIAVMTVQRDYHGADLDYVTQVVGELLFLLNAHVSHDIDLVICNATLVNRNRRDPEHFLEKVLGDKRIIGFNSSSYLGLPDGGTVKNKETMDYISCLDLVRKQCPTASWIIVNEDDGLPRADYLPVIEQIMVQLDQLAKKKNSFDVSHVKLFHPSNVRKLPHLIHVFVVPLTIVSIIQIIAHFKNKVNYTLLVLLFFVLASLLFALGAENTGRAHHWFRLAVPLVPPESCCSPVVVFPLPTLNTTMEYLQQTYVMNVGRGILLPKDSLMDELPHVTGLRVLMTEYNIVEHIGMYTTQREKPRFDDS